MYGAGNIGRGFIGEIFYLSGYEPTFIDVAEPVVDALNREGRYPVRILSGDGSCEDRWIEGVRAVNGRNTEAAADAIAGADIMATAVGVRVLPLIAPVIAAGLKKRFACGDMPLNIIICENLVDADKALERLIKEHLSEKEQAVFDERIGLVKASIGRMVPLQTEQMQDGNPLRVCVEAYGLLPVDRAAFKGSIPALQGMCPFDNFDLYVKRKLFIHNMGHAACAYLGMIRGDTCIYEAAACGGILFIAQNAMLESAGALSAHYHAPLADMHAHIIDLLRRFSNKTLADTCARVGADTARKLGNGDRFIGALRLCAEEGVTPAFISAGTAAALYGYLSESNAPQSREAAIKALKEVSALEPHAPETERVLAFHALLAPFGKGGDFDEMIAGIIATAFSMV
jgi:mannitol-1-phosphate 5-dehydrogenase